MKIIINKEQLDNLYYILGEQTTGDKKTDMSSLTGPFNCLEYITLNIGNGEKGPDRKMKKLIWSYELLSDTGDDCGTKTIPIKLEKKLVFNKHPIIRSTGKLDTSKPDYNMTFEVIVTTYNCGHGNTLITDKEHVLQIVLQFDCRTQKDLYVKETAAPYYAWTRNAAGEVIDSPDMNDYLTNLPSGSLGPYDGIEAFKSQLVNIFKKIKMK